METINIGDEVKVWGNGYLVDRNNPNKELLENQINSSVFTSPVLDINYEEKTVLVREKNIFKDEEFPVIVNTKYVSKTFQKVEELVNDLFFMSCLDIALSNGEILPMFNKLHGTDIKYSKNILQDIIDQGESKFSNINYKLVLFIKSYIYEFLKPENRRYKYREWMDYINKGKLIEYYWDQSAPTGEANAV